MNLQRYVSAELVGICLHTCLRDIRPPALWEAALTFSGPAVNDALWTPNTGESKYKQQPSCSPIAGVAGQTEKMFLCHVVLINNKTPHLLQFHFLLQTGMHKYRGRKVLCRGLKRPVPC